MYVTSVIDIPLWDRADWYGTFFGICQDGRELPLLGPLFRDAESGQKIFARWRKVVGDLDVHELIQVSIIEGEISGEPPGYTVYIGTNPAAAAGLAGVRKRDDASTLIAMTGRFHRMTPGADSPNLQNFKAAYGRSNAYLLLPAVQDGANLNLAMDLAIQKKHIRFAQATGLSRGKDVEYVVLKRPEDAMPVAKEDEPNDPPMTTVRICLPHFSVIS